MSARRIFYPRSREERNKSPFFFLFLLTRENARAACPSRPSGRDTRARASRPFLFSCTRTRVDDYVSEVALPNVIADGGTQTSWMDVKRILFSFFPSSSSLFFLFVFFLNPISDVYLHAFKSHRRIRGSRADRNIDLTR